MGEGTPLPGPPLRGRQPTMRGEKALPARWVPSAPGHRAVLLSSPAPAEDSLRRWRRLPALWA